MARRAIANTERERRNGRKESEVSWCMSAYLLPRLRTQEGNQLEETSEKLGLLARRFGSLSRRGSTVCNTNSLLVAAAAPSWTYIREVERNAVGAFLTHSLQDVPKSGSNLEELFNRSGCDSKKKNLPYGL